MFKALLFCFTLSAGLHSATAQAEFIDTDWKTSGDKRAVLDTETGIEWLDLSQTRNMSINNVISQLDTTFKGWRLPTQAEVTDMMQRFFTGYSIDVAQHRYYSNGDTVGFGLGYRFRNLFNTGLTANPSRTQGLYRNDDGTVEMTGVYISTIVDYWTVGRNVKYTMDYKTNDTYNVAMSVFLVSDGGTTLSSINDPFLNINNPNAPINQADVPVTSLFGGLMLLGVMSLRRKTALVK